MSPNHHNRPFAACWPQITELRREGDAKKLVLVFRISDESGFVETEVFHHLHNEHIDKRKGREEQLKEKGKRDG